jgi:L-2-hydroxyglutarate oxidase
MTKLSNTSDFIVIGGGVIGISLARALKKEFPDAEITLLEKEKTCGFHASGRNSGVLHAGFYYTKDSLKAKFTKLGNELLTEYCVSRNIPVNRCGKLVVARNDDELQSLDVLLQRGLDNGVVLQDITEAEAKQIEPRVLTYQRAIFSPNTSSVHPKSVVEAMRIDAEQEGIRICCDTKYLKRRTDGAFVTSQGIFHTKFVVNAGGLYADKIARDFNFSKNYRILPFKGLYLYSDEPAHSMKTLIYPVPDLKNPFLGVHFTINAEGQAKLGPTAIPALWREQYDFRHRFSIKEFLDIAARQMGLVFYSGFDFKKIALEEIKKYSKSHMVKLSKSLAKGVEASNFTQFGVPGIRAQLLNIKEKKLEMDFIIEGDKDSIHILNAVSPGFTSSLPFSQYVCEKVRALVG